MWWRNQNWLIRLRCFIPQNCTNDEYAQRLKTIYNDRGAEEWSTSVTAMTNVEMASDAARRKTSASYHVKKLLYQVYKQRVIPHYLVVIHVHTSVNIVFLFFCLDMFH